MWRVCRSARAFLPGNLRCLLWVAVAVIFAPPALPAGTGWTSVGPFGGGGVIRAVAADGASPGTVYVGTDAGVFKSVDGGTSWGAVNSGLTGFTVNALAIDPMASGTLYAGTNAGVFQTVNGGNAWSALQTGIGSLAVTSLKVDPTDSRILYAGTGAGVFKTTDGGATWLASTNGLANADVRSIAVAPASAPRSVWAGTAAGVFVSTDGGGSWTAAPGFAMSVRALAVDPVSPSVVYAGVDRSTSSGGVFKSLNGGTSWVASNGGLGNVGVLSIAVCQTLTSTAYVATDAGVFVTRDAGASWKLLAGSPSMAQSLALDPAGPGVFAGTAAGFYRSPDEGATWRQQTGSFSPFTVYALIADAAASNTLYAAVARPSGGGGGVFKTSNGGATWTVLAGLPDLPVRALASGPGSGSTAPLYAGTSGAGVLRSLDGGATWAPVNSGLTSPNVRAIATGGSNIVYVATEAGVFRSGTGGDSWSEADNGLADRNVAALALDPGNPAVVYAGTGPGVYKTTDAGASWTAVASGLPNAGIVSLAIDPLDPQKVYAGTVALFSTGFPSGMGVYRTTDGGATWWPSNSGIENLVVGSIACDPTGASMYAGTSAGVYRVARASGGAETWTAMNEGLAGQFVNTVLVDRSNPSTLYAGVTGNGVFKSTAASAAGTCTGGPSTLCLNGNRFSVEVAWHSRTNGTAGVGMAVPLASDTGAFWFFTSGNIELVVKVVDGRAFNGAFWVFYGAMSDVEYTVTVTDTMAGQRKTYKNQQGQLASVADTSAFPNAAASPSSATAATAGTSGASPAAATTASASACTADATSLCLNGGRFRVQVDWLATAIGQSGHGQASPLSSDSGSFWFFSPGNLELNVKVVDGRAVDGRFWVFYGALSDVQYTITITDTATGMQRMYSNPQGRLASVADTSAF